MKKFTSTVWTETDGTPSLHAKFKENLFFHEKVLHNPFLRQPLTYSISMQRSYMHDMHAEVIHSHGPSKRHIHETSLRRSFIAKIYSHEQYISPDTYEKNHSGTQFR